MQSKVAAVITAAGYGSFRPGVSKMLETVEEDADRPMVVEVAKQVLAAGLEQVVVVINQTYGDSIKECFAKHGLTNISFVAQRQRMGAADAVDRAIQHFDDSKLGVTDVLVVFGDMPLWTSTTMTSLIQRHLFNHATVSLVTVHLNGGSHHLDELRRYGRIVREKAPSGRLGPIREIVEPGPNASGRILGIPEVNPSLYVVSTKFFKGAYPEFRPSFKNDGHPGELHMPDAVRIAHEKGETVWDMPLANPVEALGVNKIEELEEVRAIIAKEKVNGQAP